MSEFFGTDGIRQQAHFFTEDLNQRIGMAVGTYFAYPGETITIGGDTRDSTARIVRAVGEGLAAAGVIAEVIEHPMPTPGIAHLTRESDAQCGVVVTASHNPHTYNGVKLFSAEGSKLPDKAEKDLNRMITDGVPGRAGGGWSVSEGAHNVYSDFLVDSAGFESFKGLQLGLDMAHGAASGYEHVFSELDAQIHVIGNEPDGHNINDGYGAAVKGLTQLRQLVLERGLDMGAAFDGDADRIMMVDEQGRVVNGDHILYILGVAGAHKGIVATPMTNLGAEQAMNREGIELVREDVGDRNVLRGLESTGLLLGGEQSGHIIQPNILATGDGMLAAISVIRAVRASGKTLGQWRDEVQLLPQSLVNVDLPDREVLQHPVVAAYLARAEQGFGDKGRFVPRPSGTEPVFRVMVEQSGDEDGARMTAERIADGLRRVIASVA